MKKALKHELKVGDCLKASWGYDQTNIDYYQVIALRGETQAVVQRIESLKIADSNHDMSGTASPKRNAFVGSPLVRKVQFGNAVAISSFEWARKCAWNDVAIWTAYA